MSDDPSGGDEQIASLRICLLGGFRVQREGGAELELRRKKCQALLAYLGLCLGRSVLRDTLAALFWGDTGDEQARHSLRQTLFTLRSALPGELRSRLVIAGDRVGLDPDGVQVDVVCFERLVADGTPAALAQALGLYAGDFLEGFSVGAAPFEEWLRVERERLHELALEAAARLCAHQMASEDGETAIQTALQLLRLDPLQEVTHRALMRLYVRQGRRAMALRQYQVCVDVLRRELGVDPEDATRQIYQEILAGTVSAEPVSRRPRRRHGGRKRRDRTAVMLDTPLVGRDAEIERLRECLRDAWRRGGTVVALVGEAGVGKTRLAEELCAVAGRRGGALLVGRSYESAQIVPYGVWIEAIRDGLETVRNAVSGLSPAWRTELARLLPELGSAETPSPLASDVTPIFEALTQLAEHLVVERPLVLLLEDLHWADEMSLRLLPYLTRRLRTWPALMVVTLREEELSDAPLLQRVLDEIARSGLLVHMVVSPLSRAETARLVQVVAGGDSPSTLLEEHIWRISEGNPFLAVEATRAFDDGTRPPEPLPWPTPKRIRDLVLLRLDRLSERARHLVTVASVIGRPFDFEVLWRAAGVEEHEAARGLEEIVRRRLLHGVGEQFDFLHALVRDVTVRELLEPQRMLLHRAIARALEVVYADDLAPHCAALGAHYAEGEVWDKAFVYLRRAGGYAWARWALGDAIEYYERALAALVRLPDATERAQHEITLRMRMRNALIFLAQHRRALAHLEEAEKLARKIGSSRWLGHIAIYQSSAYRYLGENARALEAACRGRDLAHVAGDAFLEANADHHLGQVLYTTGEYRRARELLACAVTALEGEPGEPRSQLIGGNRDYGRFAQDLTLCIARSWLVLALIELGEFEEGIARMEHNRRNFEATRHAYHAATTDATLGRLLLARGNPHEAIDVLVRAYEAAPRVDPSYGPAVASQLGLAYARAGRITEGLELIERGVEQSEALGRLGGHARCLTALGEAYLLAGRAGDAGRAAMSALVLAREQGERGVEAWALRLHGATAWHRDAGDVETAARYCRQALTLADERGMRPLAALCQRDLAALGHGRG